MSLACLENIIGLAPEGCECDGTPPTGFSESSSGYYLTDVEYGFPVRFAASALADCTESDIWDALSNAREQAVRDVEQDIQNELMVSKEGTFKAWRGVIGETSSNRRGTTGRQYAGVQIKPMQRSIDRSFVITAIWAGFSHTGTVDVTLSSNAHEFLPVTYSLDTVANKFTRNALESPKAISLYDIAQPGLTYALTYEPEGLTAMDNRKHCSCGRLPGWVKEIEVSGFASDEPLSQRGAHYDPRICNNRMWGIAIEGYFACEDIAFLCRLDELGQANIKSLLGRAVSYKAALKLMLKADKSEKVNQFTLLGAEERAARMHMYSEAYAEILKFITRNVPTGASSCWGCNKGGMRTTTRMI